MDSLIFREATMDDMAQLKTLEQCVVEAERPFNPDIKVPEAHYYDLVELIQSPAAYLLVAEKNAEFFEEKVIVATGYAQIRASKPSLRHQLHAYLGFMYVTPDFRGQGLNQKIIERLKKWSKEQGVDTCYLDVYSHNQAAIRAYEKAGFSSNMIEMKCKL